MLRPGHRYRGVGFYGPIKPLIDAMGPVHGRDRVARLLFAAQGERLSVSGLRLVEINGQPGALFVDTEGQSVVAVSLDIAEDLVQTLRAVSDPEKLRHLGTVSS